MISFAFLRLIDLPHHVQLMTAARARTTPAAAPPAIALTGTCAPLDPETGGTVGREEPPVVIVVVMTAWLASTSMVVKVGLGLAKGRLALSDGLEDVAGMGDGEAGRVEERERERG